ncbi:regulatory protein RecX [Spirosoma radiotolerans]|uniref:Regulatory protein RecX n=1 Tax=Spirosoma radiotolerans TaxID=1379870 RepID=A0A0E3V4R3_9BACT|nr:regulatory protein RecX [Spirosoma radiotolerans]AKD53527.1 RecX family transcriptional regulator [Spirosoma radiotolerans]
MTDSVKDALRKAAMFCAYQERTQQEVRDRLNGWGVYVDDAEEVIAELIQQNYLNEERFAKSFAGGKFRVKGWGRRKIKQQLQQRGISGYNLDQAMKEIAPDDYRETLADLLAKKRQSLRDDNPLVVKQKLVRYALSKGYESELIFTVLNGEE